MADVTLTVGVDAKAVDAAIGSLKTAWSGLGSKITDAMSGAIRGVVSGLTEVVAAQGKISFASQHAQVREFELATARLAISSGRDLEGMRASFEATGLAIGKRPGEIAAWTTEVGKLTYNFEGAAASIQGLQGLAAQTGRDVGEYRGLAVELANIGRVGGDTTHVIGVMTAQAQKLGVQGGVAAFVDQIQGLSDTISKFAVKSEADFTKVTAVAGLLGKGLGPAAAARVGEGALGAIASDPLRWERFLGRQITDSHGQVPAEDVGKILQEITDKVKRRYRGDARRVLMLNFGPEVGAALYGANFDEAGKLAGLPPSTKPAEAAANLAKTDAAQRLQADAELAKTSRTLFGSSTALGQAADALQKYAAQSPITSTLISSAVGSAFAGVLGGVVPKLAGGLISAGVGGTARTAGALGGGIGLGVLGAAAAAGIYGIERSEEAAEERFKLEHRARESEADSALGLKRIAIRRANMANRNLEGLSPEERATAVNVTADILTKKPATEALTFTRGGEATTAAVLSALQAKGREGEDAARIARAITEAMKNVKFNVINAGPGPIAVTDAGGQSMSAGPQSGG